MIDTRNDLLSTLSQFSGKDNVIVVPRAFVEFLDGSLYAAMMLSQLLYWWDRKKNRKAVYKSDAEWQSELYISRYSVRVTAAYLVKRGLIRIEVRRARGSPTSHYFLIEEELERQWKAYIGKCENEQSE